MTDEEMIATIKDCVVAAQPELSGLKLEKDTVLNKDLGVDSMNFILIICKIEAAFNVSIPDEDMMQLSTVQDVIDEIRKCQK